MKILFCTNAFQNVTNGPVKFANIILEINQLYAEHELRILTEDITQERADELKYVYKLTLRIPLILKPLGQIVRWFIYYNKIKQIQREYDFDVLVYINSFNGTWTSLVSNKPTVGMINDEKNMLATWQNFELKPLWIKRFMFQQFEKLSAKKHKLIIANSLFLRNRILTKYNLPPQKVTYLYKSIDFDGITFNLQRDFSNPIKILFVKADYLVGQLPRLLEALKILDKYRFQLTVIGPEPQFESHVKSLFEGIYNVEASYIGAQPQAQVYGYMRTYDIFCVPSYTEAFGVANIEALAHGIAVVSTQVGGIPEVLDHGNNGWLVPSDNTTALAKAIAECIENPAMREQKAKTGNKFVQRFSKNAMMASFVDMLQAVVINKSRN